MFSLPKSVWFNFALLFSLYIYSMLIKLYDSDFQQMLLHQLKEFLKHQHYVQLKVAKTIRSETQVL